MSISDNFHSSIFDETADFQEVIIDAAFGDQEIPFINEFNDDQDVNEDQELLNDYTLKELCQF